jgi:hypothetical protein
MSHIGYIRYTVEIKKMIWNPNSSQSESQSVRSEQRTAFMHHAIGENFTYFYEDKALSRMLKLDAFMKSSF